MLTMVWSFLFFGAIPFVFYTVMRITSRSHVNAESDDTFSALTLVFNLVVLFLVGSLKSTFGSVSWLRAGIETLALGLLCGGASFFVASSIIGRAIVK